MCLASQYAYLLTAARQGRSFAEIAAELLDSSDGSVESLGTQAVSNYSITGVEEDDLHENVVEPIGKHEQLDLETTDHGDSHNARSSQPLKGLDDHSAEQEDIFEYQVQELSEDIPEAGHGNGGADAEHDEGENEKSATSTVRGDEAESQGEYDPLLEICFKPGFCSCTFCDTNQNADIETTKQFPSEASHSSTLARDEALPVRDGPDAADEFVEEIDGNLETASAQLDTESSRTLEADGEAHEQRFSAQDEAGYSLINHGDDVYDGGHEKIEFLDDLGDEDDETASQDHFAIGQTEDDAYVANDAEADRISQSQQDQPDEKVLNFADTEGVVLDAEEEDLFDFDHEEHDHLFDESNSGAESRNSKSEGDSVQETASAGKELSRPQLHSESDSQHNTTPPATPPGVKSSKRKARDEDDFFDFLETDTPDSKRRRPS